jgi:hypothetical protein
VLTKYGYAEITRIKTKHLIIQNQKTIEIVIKLKKCADFEKNYDDFVEEVAKKRGQRLQAYKSTSAEKAPKPDGTVSNNSDSEAKSGAGESKDSAVKTDGVEEATDLLVNHSVDDGDDEEEDKDSTHEHALDSSMNALKEPTLVLDLTVSDKEEKPIMIKDTSDTANMILEKEHQVILVEAAAVSDLLVDASLAQ